MRVLFFMFLISLSVFSDASSLYVWDRSDLPGTDSYPDGDTACKAYRGQINTGQMWYNYALSETEWYCRLNNYGTMEYVGRAKRRQITCPYGHTGTSCNASCDLPNMLVDGQCQAPPPDACAGKAGQAHGFKKVGHQSDADAFYNPSGSTWVHPDTVSTDGCNATVSPMTTKCTVHGDGYYSCTGSAVYSGVSSVPEDQSTETDDCPDCVEDPATPTTENSSDCTQWVYDGEGRRTRTCETVAEANKPGRAKCLTDGSLVCVSASPTPEKDTKTRTDDVKETPDADGGKTTETTSTTNKTYCAAGACTTTTTTNKTTVVTNGSGEVTSSSGTCEGDDCGDPKSQEEENDEAPEQAELPQVGEDDDPGYGESLSNFTGRIQNSPLISAVSSIAFPSGGGSCSMGSVSLWGGSISFNYFCSMAAPVLGGLRYLFLSIWAIAAVRLFMTA